MIYRVLFAPPARRALGAGLPEAVAAAALELIFGDLAEQPHRVGKRLHPPLADRHCARRGTYRVVYRIDDETSTVTILAISHRRDTYRS